MDTVELTNWVIDRFPPEHLSKVAWVTDDDAIAVNLHFIVKHVVHALADNGFIDVLEDDGETDFMADFNPDGWGEEE